MAPAMCSRRGSSRSVWRSASEDDQERIAEAPEGRLNRIDRRKIERGRAAGHVDPVPIDGEAGVGYILRKGFDLPPLMFTADEVEAIAVGARMVQRLRDPRLQEAADSVYANVTTVLPESLRATLANPPIFVSPGWPSTRIRVRRPRVAGRHGAPASSLRRLDS